MLNNSTNPIAIRSNTPRLRSTKAASRRYRTTIGNTKPMRALRTRVSVARASIPRKGRSLGQSRTSRPGGGRRGLLAAVVVTSGRGEVLLRPVEDDHGLGEGPVTKRERTIHTHRDEEEREIHKGITVHPPGERPARRLTAQLDAIPEQATSQECGCKPIECSQCTEEGWHESERQKDQS